MPTKRLFRAQRTFRVAWVLLLAAALLGALPAGAHPVPQTSIVAAAPAWQSRVDPWVLKESASGPAEFLVFLAEQADLSGAEFLPTKAARGAYVYRQLSQTAARTQPALLQALRQAQAADPGVEYQSLWVANMVWVRGPAALVQALARRPDVAHLYANPWVQLKETAAAPADDPRRPAAAVGIEWNITKVGAPQVWALGVTGQGAVIGGQDTGYDWDHPALKNQYRGWNGSAANHNYNWHDAIHTNDYHTPAGNPCGFNLTVPCDDGFHGTHTMGSMVGDDGGSNQVGVAPGARWIGCRNMEQGWGTPATYAECYQWFIAPTDLNGQNPRPDLAPDVINNSWGCPTSEGCTDPNVLKSVVEAVRAAGILTVHSAGNYGSACSTVSEPAAIYDASFSVGATDINDAIASFSSRGPVTVDGSNRLKPDISAPGQDVRSSVPGTGYGLLSGTSMAAPHVAGLAALMVSAQPALSGRPALIESLVQRYAVPRTTTQTCGGVSGSSIPNNTFGYGRIDAFTTIQHVPTHILDAGKRAERSYYLPEGRIDFTITVTNTNLLTPTTGLVITDVLPAGTQLISATLPYSQQGALLRWDIPSLGAGASTVVKLAVAANPGVAATIVNQDYGARSSEAPFSGGLPVAVIPAGPLALQVRKTAALPFYLPGETITYTLRVTNTNFYATAHLLALSDTLPASVTLLGGDPAFSQVGGVVRWDFAALGPRQTLSAVLAVQAWPSATSPITNTGYLVTSAESAPASGPPLTLLRGLQVFLPLAYKP